MKKIPKCLFLLALSIAAIGNASAQDTTAAKTKWHFLVQPYLMFANMNGQVGLGELPDADINPSASDIFSNLQFGAMLYAEASNDRWAITSDIIYMDLGADIEGKRGILSGEAGTKQFVWELAGLRKLRPWLEGGIGFRIINIKSDLEMQVNASVPGGAGPRSRSISETWVDPVIIGRVKFPAKKWLFQVRGDVGGFGIGSNFTWQVHPEISYRFSKLFEMSIAYRVIGIDYENGSGSDRFKYDVETYGPEVKFGFHF